MTELAIIGVKLFAAGSQADVFINRVEDQAFGLFYGEDM